MIATFVVAGGLLAAAVPLGPVFGRLALNHGPDSGPAATTASGAALAAGAIRSAAAAAAVVLAVGGVGGDLVVLAVLAAVAVGPRASWVAFAMVAVPLVGALRAGSSAVADVAGAHTVVGPALLSPEWDVAVPAALALGAGLVATLALMPRASGWRDLPARPGAVADALLPLVAALTVLVVTVGPPVSDAPDSGVWLGVRLAVLVGSLPAVALLRRLVALDERILGAVAAAIAAVALTVSLLADV